MTVYSSEPLFCFIYSNATTHRRHSDLLDRAQAHVADVATEYFPNLLVEAIEWDVEIRLDCGMTREILALQGQRLSIRRSDEIAVSEKQAVDTVYSVP
jgi:hypothetical protein